MERERFAGRPGRRMTRLWGEILVVAMLVALCACVVPAGAAGGSVPKKEGVYLVDGAKNLPLQEAGSIWKLQGPAEPIVVLPTVRAGSERPTLLLVGKFQTRRVRLVKLKSQIYDMGKMTGMRFNTLGWVEEKEIELGEGAEKGGSVRISPVARLDAGIYALVEDGTGRRYPFGVGDLEKAFSAADIDPRTYIRVVARDQKRFDMLGHNLKGKFSGRFMFLKDDDVVPHPTNPELKFGLSAFKEADHGGTPVSTVTINVVKNMALIEVHTLTADGISFPANIDGCYFELVNRSRLPDNRSQYGLLIHCPK